MANDKATYTENPTHYEDVREKVVEKGFSFAIACWETWLDHTFVRFKQTDAYLEAVANDIAYHQNSFKNKKLSDSMALNFLSWQITLFCLENGLTIADFFGEA